MLVRIRMRKRRGRRSASRRDSCRSAARSGRRHPYLCNGIGSGFWAVWVAAVNGDEVGRRYLEYAIPYVCPRLALEEHGVGIRISKTKPREYDRESDRRKSEADSAGRSSHASLVVGGGLPFAWPIATRS